MENQAVDPPAPRQRGSNNVPCLGGPGLMPSKPAAKKSIPSPRPMTQPSAAVGLRPPQTYAQRFRNAKQYTQQVAPGTEKDSPSSSGNVTPRKASKIPMLSTENLMKPLAGTPGNSAPILFNLPKPKTSIPKPVPQKPKIKVIEAPKTIPRPAAAHRPGLGIGYAPRHKVAAKLAGAKDKKINKPVADKATSAGGEDRAASKSETPEAIAETEKASKIPKPETPGPSTRKAKAQPLKPAVSKPTSISKIPLFRKSTVIISKSPSPAPSISGISSPESNNEHETPVATVDVNLNFMKPEADSKPADITDTQDVSQPADITAVEAVSQPADITAVEADSKPAEIAATEADSKPAEIPATEADSKPADTIATEADPNAADTISTEADQSSPTDVPCAAMEDSSFQQLDPEAAAKYNDIEAKMAELEAKIAKAEYEEYLESLQQARVTAIETERLLQNLDQDEEEVFEDSVTFLPPAEMNETEEVAKMRDEAFNDLQEEILQTEKPATEKPSSHVQVLFPACRVDYSKSDMISSPTASTSKVVELLNELALCEAPAPATKEVIRTKTAKAAKKRKPRDINNNIIVSQEIKKVIQKPETLPGRIPSDSNLEVFHSCETLKTVASETTSDTKPATDQKEDFVPVSATEDYQGGPMNPAEMSALWKECIEELRLELMESRTPSLRGIRFPVIEPEPIVKKKSKREVKFRDPIEEPGGTVHRELTSRVRQSQTGFLYKAVIPKVYPPVADITQQEVEMLLRSRFPNTFDLTDLPPNVIYSTRFPFWSRSNFRSKDPASAYRIFDLQNNCPVEMSTILRMKPMLCGNGLWGEITMKNICDDPITFRLRASVDGKYRVTPPVGCIGAKQIEQILVKTSEAVTELENDRLLLEFVPLAKNFENIYSLYEFWEKIRTSDKEEMIQALVTPTNITEDYLRHRKSERNKKYALYLFASISAITAVVGIGIEGYYVLFPKPVVPPNGYWYWY